MRDLYLSNNRPYSDLTKHAQAFICFHIYLIYTPLLPRRANPNDIIWTWKRAQPLYRLKKTHETRTTKLT